MYHGTTTVGVHPSHAVMVLMGV